MNNRHQYGFSLLSVVIVVAVVGIFASLFTNTVNNNLQMLKVIQEQDDFAGIRRHIRFAMSCGQTVAANHCDSTNQPIKILRSDGSTLVDAGTAEFTKFGLWQVTAFCASAINNDYIFKIKRINETESQFRDLLKLETVGC